MWWDRREINAQYRQSYKMLYAQWYIIVLRHIVAWPCLVVGVSPWNCCPLIMSRHRDSKLWKKEMRVKKCKVRDFHEVRPFFFTLILWSAGIHGNVIFFFCWLFCTTVNGNGILKSKRELHWNTTKWSFWPARYVKTELFYWEFESTVWCVGFWTLSQRGIKMMYYSTFWNDRHASRRGLQSHTNTLPHTDMSGTWLWLPDGSSTLEHGTHNDSVWHT